jgi:hypothetical protein
VADAVQTASESHGAGEREDEVERPGRWRAQ